MGRLGGVRGARAAVRSPQLGSLPHRPHLRIRPHPGPRRAHFEAAPGGNATSRPANPCPGGVRGSALVGLTPDEQAILDPGCRAAKRTAGMGDPRLHARAGTPASPSRAAPGALRGEPCKILSGHLPPRDTSATVPVFGRWLRQQSESDQCRDGSPGRGPAPWGTKAYVCKPAAALVSPDFYSSSGFQDKNKAALRSRGGVRPQGHSARLGAPLVPRSPDAKPPRGRPLPGGSWAAASVSSFWRPADSPWGSLGPGFRLSKIPPRACVLLFLLRFRNSFGAADLKQNKTKTPGVRFVAWGALENRCGIQDASSEAWQRCCPLAPEHEE